jgi:hypothetical protein
MSRRPPDQLQGKFSAQRHFLFGSILPPAISAARISAAKDFNSKDFSR